MLRWRTNSPRKCTTCHVSTVGGPLGMWAFLISQWVGKTYFSQDYILVFIILKDYIIILFIIGTGVASPGF